jgi:uncharacterized protein
MYTREHVLDTLKASRALLQERFHVRALALFGSYSRNEQTEDSDIDVLVEFSAPISGFQFVAMADELEKCLGRPVDVVPADGMKTHYRNYIQNELIYVWQA